MFSKCFETLNSSIGGDGAQKNIQGGFAINDDCPLEKKVAWMFLLGLMMNTCHAFDIGDDTDVIAVISKSKNFAMVALVLNVWWD